MTKINVRQSKIDDPDSPANRKYNKAVDHYKTKKVIDIDDDDDDIDPDDHYNEDGGKRMTSRTMVAFPQGVFMDVWSIQNITKIQEVNENTGRWKYGISVNKGVTQSIRYPYTDIEFWFPTLEVRDKAYEEYVQVFEDTGSKVIKMR